jgi:hypothetical protein
LQLDWLLNRRPASHVGSLSTGQIHRQARDFFAARMCATTRRSV